MSLLSVLKVILFVILDYCHMTSAYRRGIKAQKADTDPTKGKKNLNRTKRIHAPIYRQY